MRCLRLVRELLGWMGDKRMEARSSLLKDVGGVGFGIPCTGGRIEVREGCSVIRLHTIDELWV